MPEAIKKLLASLKANMVKELSSKTGWGRNEILAALDRAIIAALQDLIE